MRDVVFPIWKAVDGRCSCPRGADCSSPGKHRVGNLAPRGFKDAKPLAAWGDLSTYSLGIPTGAASGIDVIDIDTPEAEAYWTSVAPNGYRVRTGGGGLHIYLEHRPGRVCGTRSFKGQFVSGTDIRSDGGYVVAAGSTHVSGRLYEALGAPTDLPDWAFEHCLPRGPKLPEGQRNPGLTSVAGRLRAAGNELPELIQRLRQENMRCDPPLELSEVDSVARSVARYPPNGASGPAASGDPPPAGPRRRGGPSVAQLLVEIGGEAELFHDDQSEAYATVKIDAHCETYRIRSGQMRSWLLRRYRAKFGKVPGGQGLKDAAVALEAAAQYDWGLRPAYTRIGWDGDALWIDLADPDWRAVKVSATGWEIVAQPSVRFVRGKAQGRLPEPVRGGSLCDLLPFLNARDPNDEHFVLAVAWLIGAYHARGPYPMLYLLAERGSGKSSAATTLRSLIDPSPVPLRSLPRDERDLAVAARGSWVLGFDNVSELPRRLSDALCRLSTGGGFGTRQLYTDDDEVLFGGRRPTLMNGIPAAVSEPDLRDRVLIAHWPRLGTYRTDEEMAAQFGVRAPRILGAILDALVEALKARARDTASTGRLPRMADFFQWVVASEAKLPWRAGRFAEVFEAARTSATQSSLAESLLGQTIISFTRAAGAWEGTATELLEVLTLHAGLGPGPGRRVPSEWPRNARALSSALRTLAPDLRDVAVFLAFEKQGKARTRVIRLAGEDLEESCEFASAPSFASAAANAPTDGADAADAKVVGPSASKGLDEGGGGGLTAELDLSSQFGRFGLSQFDAFPDIRFHGVVGGSPRVALVSRLTAQLRGRPWGIGIPAAPRGQGDTQG